MKCIVAGVVVHGGDARRIRAGTPYHAAFSNLSMTISVRCRSKSHPGGCSRFHFRSNIPQRTSYQAVRIVRSHTAAMDEVLEKVN